MRLSVLKLRTTMIKSDTNQKELASKTGLSYSMINAICNGRACAEDTGIKIAEALGVKVDELRERG